MEFVPNVGQYGDGVLFKTVPASDMAILSDGTVVLGDVRISFGSKPRFIVGDLPTGARVSYFKGRISIGGVPTYRRVLLKEVYPNIDAAITPTEEGLEIQFFVRPGGKPRDVRMSIHGGDLRVGSDGIYVGERVKIASIRAYQGALEIPVDAVVSGGDIRFSVGEYAPQYTLVIDPVAVILAGSADDVISAVAVDSSGNIVVVGETYNSDNFAPDRTFFGVGGNYDAFVSKLSPDLTTHIATAILGGDENDYGYDVAITASGDIIVVGATLSPDFAPIDTIFGTRGGYDAFVVLLSSDLSEILRYDLLASNEWADFAYSVVLDDSGNVVVGGYTSDYSTFSVERVVFGTPGADDAFITKLSADLRTHIRTAILGGSLPDQVMDLALDSLGNILAVGSTYSSDFAPERIIHGTPGSLEAFVSKLSGDLTTHISTALLTGDSYDVAHGVAVLPSGEVIVVGNTWNSGNFAPERRLFGTPGYNDAFVSKLSANLSEHIATSILASNASDYAQGIALSPDGVIAVGEVGDASSFVPDRVILGSLGFSEGFASLLTPDSLMPVRTVILAGEDVDAATAVVLGRDGDPVVVGATEDPSTFLSDRLILGTPGESDGFLVKLPPYLSLSEDAEDGDFAVHTDGRRITVILRRPSYVGYDVYSPDGRLLRRVSLGYLPPGRHERVMDLPTGAYVLLLRIGESVVVRRFIHLP